MAATPRAVVAMALLALAGTARAQAGPPMITNDPDTPGPGVWEINLAAAGGAHNGDWDLSAPDLDINRGVGERVQLSVHGSWAHARADGGWASGFGDVELGARWRFLDQDTAGVSVAVQPLWIHGGSPAARRRGLASTNPEWVLPIQAAKEFGSVSIGTEVARHVVAHEADAWQAGAFVAHDCRRTITCLAEINATRVDGEAARATLNIGARYALREGLLLMGSLGSEVSGVHRQPLVFYLGVQHVR
ncbi:hypothetical protein [Lysobacter claricitrinus]|uniref:hypothetical protein n=1 Tax=Lysobacter claricitrinus TaxID=3367728 RepID=UPI0037DAA682